MPTVWVTFLESVGADQRGRNLAGQADERDRIHQRVLQRCDGIGGARTRGHQHDADLAGGAGVTFGRMACPLLVANEDVLDILLLEDLVVDRQDRAAGIAEDMFDAVVLQRLENDLRSRHPIACRLIVRAHLSVPFDAGIAFVAGSPNFGHKKRPRRSLSSSAWVAIAGWLHHPAHALSHHDKSRCDFHGRK
ncbi:hypothetical protein ACVMH6_007460 [Rhizobium leguminosarum]